MTPHALFVVFHYPPEASSSGVLRTLKYTRYLGKHGWRVTVLTVRPGAYAVVDPALERQIPADVRVVRTASVNTKRQLSIRGRHLAVTAVPDSWIGWYPWATAAGRRILQEDPAQLVYSTSPPASAHVIAGSLARWARLPWVMDFRDPWYEEPPEPGTSRLVHLAARRLERRLVHRAARVVASTARLRDTMAERYASEARAKFVAIPNGYDEADFTDLAPPDRPSRDEFLVVHAGSINPEFRDPRPVLGAARAAADAGAVDPGRMRFRFLGPGPFGEAPEMARAVAALGLAGRVEFLPRVPYDQALRELGSADLLLLLQASLDTVDLVPAKLFEYLRSGRPVLAVVRPGASSEVLDTVGGGWAVDPGDARGLRDALTRAYGAWRAGNLPELGAHADRLGGFTREHLAGELARVFDEVTKP